MKNIITSIVLALTSLTLLAQPAPPMPLLEVIQPPTADDPISIKLGWDASPDTNIINYRVLWSTNASGPYERDVLVGTNLTATVTNLFLSETNYFVVTARNDIGLESLPSNELEVFIPAVRTAPPSDLKTAFLVWPVFETSTDGQTWIRHRGEPFVVPNVGGMALLKSKGLEYVGVEQLDP
jgi:hypothetical protein